MASLLVSLLLGPILLTAMPRPATAQSEARGQISLASQTAWVGAGERFDLRVDLRGIRNPESLEVVVSVRAAITSRSQFSETLDGRLLGRELLRLGPTSLADTTLDNAGTVPFSVVVDGPGGEVPAGDESRLVLDGAGVYPVRVELRRIADQAPVDAFTTYLVRTRDDDAAPLSVAWLQDIAAPLALRPDATVSLDDHALDNLAVTADALGQSGAAMTVSPRPETLDALAIGAPDLLDDLVAAIGDRQVLAGPYVEVDAAALVAAGLPEVVEAEWDEGVTTVEGVVGSADATTLVEHQGWNPADLAGLGGIERLVLPEAVFGALDRPLTLVNPFLVEDDTGRQIEATTVDPGLSAHFDAGDDPILGAQHLLGDLAVLAYDSPGLDRGVVVAPPPGWVADPDFLATVLPALADGPVVQDVTLDQLFDRVPVARRSDGAPLVRSVQTDPVAPPPIDAAGLRRSRADVASVTAMLGADQPAAARLKRLALVSASDGLSPEERASYRDGVGTVIARELDGVDISSEGRFQLTSRQATVPLTLVNDLDVAVNVAVELESEKLDFVDADTGEVHTGSTSRSLTLDPGPNPMMVSVEARASGDFPLTITLRSPDGRLEVATTRLRVRSTFPSGVGVLLSVGAGLFLATWWAKHWRTSRRDRRLVTPSPSTSA